jgi:hypothetical protein
MKLFPVTLVVFVCLLLCLTSCGVSSSNPAAPNLTSTNSAQSSQTFDMLSWMTMSPSLSLDHHMAGTANPLFTSVAPSRFFWTKTQAGFPWDVQLYDSNYIYLWVTELDWQNPRTFKVFNSPKLGKFNLPLVARYAHGGFPGSNVKISDSTYETHSNCNTYTTQNLGHVINEVWGPYQETLGGQLPNKLQTLVISYRYTCDANYSNCQNKEEYHLAKPYGLVKWQHQKLGSDGTYDPPDNVTVFNQVVSGQVTPYTACF